MSTVVFFCGSGKCDITNAALPIIFQYVFFQRCVSIRYSHEIWSNRFSRMGSEMLEIY